MTLEEIGRLVVRLIGDPSSYLSAIQQAQSATQTFASSTMSVLAQIGVSFSLIGAAVKGIQIAGGFEAAKVDLEVLLGSAEKANKVFKELVDLSTRTPLQLKDLLGPARMLALAGAPVEDLVPLITMIGNASGGSAEKLQRMTLAFEHALMQGKLTGYTLRQLTFAGFNPLKDIAAITGQDVTKVAEALHKGKIGADLLVAAFQRASQPGGTLFGRMAKQAQTIGGLFTTLKDNVILALGEIGVILIEGLDLKNVIRDVTAWAKAITEFLRSLTPETKRTIAQFALWASVIGLVTVAFVLLSPVIGGVIGLVATLAGVIYGLALGPLGVVAALGAAFYVLYELAPLLSGVFSFIGTNIKENWQLIGALFAGVKGIFDSLMASLAGMLGPLYPIWSAFTEIVLAPFRAIEEAVDSIGASFDRMGRSFTEMVNSFAVSWKGVKDALSAKDIELAWDIAWVQIKISFLTVIDAIKGIWELTVNWIAGKMEGFRDTAARTLAFIEMMFNVSKEVVKGLATGGMIGDPLAARRAGLKEQEDLEKNHQDIMREINKTGEAARTKELAKLYEERDRLTKKASQEAKDTAEAAALGEALAALGVGKAGLIDPSKYGHAPDVKLKIKPLVDWDAAVFGSAEAVHRMQTQMESIFPTQMAPGPSEAPPTQAQQAEIVDANWKQVEILSKISGGIDSVSKAALFNVLPANLLGT